MTNKNSWLYKNGLSVVLAIFMLLSLCGQTYNGFIEHNNELVELGGAAINFGEYLVSGHFLQATFENWESEFLQMWIYVVLTVYLRQIGSSESKKLNGLEEVDRVPIPHEKAPWPVKQGGIILKIYERSLSLFFLLLFLFSFGLHFKGSLADQNEHEYLLGKHISSASEYILSARFWFESFQNWQSEFLSVLSIVVLSIFLRQKGSPESKPVDAPLYETGSN
jgi:hypothetical protein